MTILPKDPILSTEQEERLNDAEYVASVDDFLELAYEASDSEDDNYSARERQEHLLVNTLNAMLVLGLFSSAAGVGVIALGLALNNACPTENFGKIAIVLGAMGTAGGISLLLAEEVIRYCSREKAVLDRELDIDNESIASEGHARLWNN